MQLGAVTNFVARNTTFIHHVGRDSYVAEAASIAVVWRDPANATGYPFPAPENFFRPGGAWRLLELPASNLQPVSQAPQVYFRKNLTQLHFFVRNSLASREAIELDVAYVAFVNPDSGATLVVDDFEHVPWTAPWPTATIMSDASAPGPTHRFLRIACGPGTSTNSRPPAQPPLQLEFDARDYPVLRLFYRVSANAPANDSGLVVIGHGPYTVPEGDFNADTPLEGSNYDFGAGGIGGGAQYPQAPGFAPVVSAFFPAHASQLVDASVFAALSPAGGGGGGGGGADGADADSFGAFTVARHYSGGVRWRRALVLLAEGALVVVDALAAAADDVAALEGWLAGPSWALQLRQPLAPVAGAPNSFDAGGFNRTGCFGAGTDESEERLLVALFAVAGAGAAEAVVGSTRGGLVGGVVVDAPWVRAPLGGGGGGGGGGGEELVFVSVLLPHGAADAAPPLAARVSAGRAGNATVVAVPLLGGAHGGGTATVTVGDDGRAWGVSRGA